MKEQHDIIIEINEKTPLLPVSSENENGNVDKIIEVFAIVEVILILIFFIGVYTIGIYSIYITTPGPLGQLESKLVWTIKQGQYIVSFILSTLLSLLSNDIYQELKMLS